MTDTYTYETAADITGLFFAAMESMGIDDPHALVEAVHHLIQERYAVDVWIGPSDYGDGLEVTAPRNLTPEFTDNEIRWCLAEAVRQDAEATEPAEPAVHLLDRVLAMDLGAATGRLELEHTGGGCMALVAEAQAGTVVVTDDGEALIGFYPGTNWSTGEDEGNVLVAVPVTDEGVLRLAILIALGRLV